MRTKTSDDAEALFRREFARLLGESLNPPRDLGEESERRLCELLDELKSEQETKLYNFWTVLGRRCHTSRTWVRKHYTNSFSKAKWLD